jgi:hypothetical protein
MSTQSSPQRAQRQVDVGAGKTDARERISHAATRDTRDRAARASFDTNFGHNGMCRAVE